MHQRVLVRFLNDFGSDSENFNCVAVGFLCGCCCGAPRLIIMGRVGVGEGWVWGNWGLRGLQLGLGLELELEFELALGLD